MRPETDGFRLAGLDTAPPAMVKPLRVAAARAHLGRMSRQLVPAGQSMLLIGGIVHLPIAPGIWRDGRVRPELLDTVGRLGGSCSGATGGIIVYPPPTETER